MDNFSLTHKTVLMIIASENFRDEEYFHTRESLEKAGVVVTVASTAKTAVSSIEKKQVDVDLLINEATDDYDGILFVGGSGAKEYFENHTAHLLVKKFFETGKVVAAICVAPMILAYAGILLGRKATVWDGSANEMRDLNINYTGEDVTVDGKIITANGPKASYRFGETVAENLS